MGGWSVNYIHVYYIVDPHAKECCMYFLNVDCKYL